MPFVSNLQGTASRACQPLLLFFIYVQLRYQPSRLFMNLFYNYFQSIRRPQIKNIYRDMLPESL